MTTEEIQGILENGNKIFENGGLGEIQSLSLKHGGDFAHSLNVALHHRPVGPRQARNNHQPRRR